MDLIKSINILYRSLISGREKNVELFLVLSFVSQLTVSGYVIIHYFFELNILIYPGLIYIFAISIIQYLIMKSNLDANLLIKVGLLISSTLIFVDSYILGEEYFYHSYFISLIGLAYIVLPRGHNNFKFIYFALNFLGLLSIEIFLSGGLVNDSTITNYYKYFYKINLITSALMVFIELYYFDAISHKLETKINQEKEKTKEANMKLEYTLSNRMNFFANMSHEIRTPLNGILGVIDIIRPKEQDQEIKEYIDIMEKSGNNLLAIVNNILDLAKYEANRMNISETSFHLSDMIKNTVEVLRPIADPLNQKINIFISEQSPHFVISDKQKLEQILTNLLSNSIKFTPKGHIDIKVFSKNIDVKNTILKIKVEDSGVGIKKEDLPTIFNQFTQSDNSSTRKFDGTGLGLSIVKKIVIKLGGTITVKSEVGKGTIFEINLPIKVGSHQNLALQKNNKTSIPKDLKFLVVEDNKVNMLVLNKMLETYGIDADKAYNGKEGLEIFKRDKHHIIFMDCHMPTMDGFEATKEIKKYCKSNKHEVTIIAVTASAMDYDKKKCLDAGFDFFISKPVTKKDIESIFEKYSKKSAS